MMRVSGTLVPATEERRLDHEDVVAMSDHASFLGTNLNFLLDATLGMINIEQNNILKIFSVVTVFLLPPSVIAGIYGMNFQHIPLLDSEWGFFGAIALMVYRRRKYHVPEPAAEMPANSLPEFPSSAH